MENNIWEIEYDEAQNIWNTEYVGAKIGYNYKFSNKKILMIYVSNSPESIGNNKAITGVLNNENVNIQDYDSEQELFFCNAGKCCSFQIKRIICAFLSERQFSRWEMTNNTGPNYVDCFVYSEYIIRCLNKFIQETNFKFNKFTRACPVCVTDINNDDVVICCANDINDGKGICCSGRVHRDCIQKYLRLHPHISHDINNDGWLCYVCDENRKYEKTPQVPRCLRPMSSLLTNGRKYNRKPMV